MSTTIRKAYKMKWYIRTVKHDFAYYGFPVCPLDDAQLEALYRANVKVDEAYGIGCDVNAGVPFERALGIFLAQKELV